MPARPGHGRPQHRVARFYTTPTVSASAGVDGIATVTGLDVALALGSVTASGAATVSVTGLSADAQEGTTTAQGAGVASPTGLTVGAALGTLTALGDGVAPVGGLDVQVALGTVSASGESSPDGTAVVTGLNVPLTLGMVSAVGDPAPDAQPYEVVGRIAYWHRPTDVDGQDATAAVTGLTVRVELGLVRASATGRASVRGLRAASSVGLLTARADASTVVSQTADMAAALGRAAAFELTVRVALPYQPIRLDAAARVSGLPAVVDLEPAYVRTDDALDREWRAVQRIHDDDLAVLV